MSYLKYLCILIISLSEFKELSAQTAGDVIITEYMANPNAVQDSDGEWVELYNTTTDSINLQGWMLKDKDTDSVVLSPLTALFIRSHSYLLLCRNSNMVVNGGLFSDYTIALFILSNTDDEIILLDGSGKVIDQVIYTINTGGKSKNLDPAKYNALDNDNIGNWCDASIPYASGDFGSPKALNESCNLSSNMFHEKDELKLYYNQGQNCIIKNGIAESTFDFVITNLAGSIIQIGQINAGSGRTEIKTVELINGIYFFKPKGLAGFSFVVY